MLMFLQGTIKGVISPHICTKETKELPICLFCPGNNNVNHAKRDVLARDVLPKEEAVKESESGSL